MQASTLNNGKLAFKCSLIINTSMLDKCGYQRLHEKKINSTISCGKNEAFYATNNVLKKIMVTAKIKSVCESVTGNDEKFSVFNYSLDAKLVMIQYPPSRLLILWLNMQMLKCHHLYK